MAMSDPSPKNRRSNTEDGMVVAVRDHLRSIIAKREPPFPCTYAFYVHPRRRTGEQGFGVITLAGESLPLTVTMLESLKRMPTLLEGVNPVVLGAADEEDVLVPGTPRGDWHEPLPVTRFMLWHGVLAGPDARALRNRTGITLSPTVSGPQLTFLTAERPVGWPR
jgi:hypothetical protein